MYQLATFKDLALLGPTQASREVASVVSIPSPLPFKPDTIRTLDEAMNLHLVGGTMNECAETAKVQDPTGNTCPSVPFSPTPFSVLIRFVAI